MPEDNNLTNEKTDQTNSQILPTGTPLESVDIDKPAGIPEPVTSPALSVIPPKFDNKKSKKGMILAIILLLLVVGGGVGWYFMNKSSGGGKSATTKVTETQDIPILKIGTGEGPASIYFPDEGVSGVQNILDRQIYEGLVGLENNKIVPIIAQSWTNPDNSTWVFKIRPNVKFHTGNKVTAKEVKASLDSLATYDYWSIFTSTIASTEVTGELEITIKTKEPDSLLLNRLVLAYITDLSVKDKAGNNGTGAYQVDTTAKNDEKSTTLVAFDGHYGGHVKTRKITYTIYESDDAIIKALKNNEIDIAETIPVPDVTKAMEGTDFRSITYDAPGSFGLYMNQRRSETTLLKNKDFRMAIALAMDRQGLIDKVGRKNIPAYQVIPKSLPGHEESNSFPKFDLTAAKASLVKSGYKNQPIEFVHVKKVQVDAPFIIEQLKALGINVKEKAFEGDDISKALAEVKAGKFDLFSAGFTSDISDARDILGALLSSTESSYPVYNNPDYDKLLADSDKAFDPVERIKLLQKANQHITDNLSWVPLRNGNYIYYYDKDIDVKNEFNGAGSIGAYYRKVGRIVK